MITPKGKTFSEKKKNAYQKVHGMYPQKINEKNIIFIGFIVFIYTGNDFITKIDGFFISKRLSTICKDRLKNGNEIFDGEEIFLPDYVMKKNRHILISCAFFVLFLITIFCIIFILEKNNFKQHEKKKLAIEQKNRELQFLEKKQNEEKYLSELKTKYKNFLLEKTVSPYFVLSEIYNCIGKNCILNSLIINKNEFSIEGKSENCISILKNFENSRSFSKVELKRLNSNPTDKKQIFYICGTAEKKHILENENSQQIVSFEQSAGCNISGRTIDENNADEYASKILFYETRIAEIEKRKKSLSQKKVSEVIKDCKKILVQCNCGEDFFQESVQNNIVQLEIGIQGKSLSIVKVFEMFSSEFDVIFAEIKNFENGNKVHVLLKVNTGICCQNYSFTETGAGVEAERVAEFEEHEVSVYTPLQISKVFYEDLPILPKIKNEEKKQIVISERSLKVIKTFVLVGKSKNERGVLLVKNTESGKIEKITSFREEENSYFFDYHGNIGEVLK
ncbi:MAG: hypothetical protein ACTTHG_04595 [Treponemataceae bacterium]